MAEFKHNLQKFKGDSGQALLIILLILSVSLTVVLSIVSRSVTEVTVTSFEEEAQRAFDAAEAGIEEVLLQQTYQSVPKTSLDANTTYEVNISNPTPSVNEFVYPTDLFAGQSAAFWLVSHHKVNGQLTCDPTYDCFRGNSISNICWGDPTTAPNLGITPAVEISIFYDDFAITPLAVNDDDPDFSQVKLARYAYDPNAGRYGSNQFTPASVSGCTIDGEDFAFSTGSINLSSEIPCWNTRGCILMAKVKMLYNYDPPPADVNYPHKVGIDLPGASVLPPQGTQLESTGVSGDSTRKVRVFESYPELPFVFDAAIYSSGGLTK